MGREDNHSTKHSKGVMILFNPRCSVQIESCTNDNNGRLIILDATVDGTRITVANINVPNDNLQQDFLRTYSKNWTLSRRKTS